MGDLLLETTSRVQAIKLAREECALQGVDPDDDTGCGDDGFPAIDSDDGQRVDYGRHDLARAIGRPSPRG